MRPPFLYLDPDLSKHRGNWPPRITLIRRRQVVKKLNRKFPRHSLGPLGCRPVSFGMFAGQFSHLCFPSRIRLVAVDVRNNALPNTLHLRLGEQQASIVRLHFPDNTQVLNSL